MHWDEGGGRTLLGDNRGGGAVILQPTRLWRVGVWISFGLSCRYIHIWLYVYSTATCVRPSRTWLLSMAGSVFICTKSSWRNTAGHRAQRKPPNCVSMPPVDLEHATRVTKSALDRMATNRCSVQWIQHVSYVPAATGEWRSTIQTPRPVTSIWAHNENRHGSFVWWLCKERQVSAEKLRKAD